MSQPSDPHEGQYRPGAPRPRSPEDFAAGSPPAEGGPAAYGDAGARPSAGTPVSRRSEGWDEEPRGERPRLGSLAQAARRKQLNQARWLLIIVGALILGVNAFVAATARSQLEAEVRKAGLQILPGPEFDAAVRLVVVLSVVLCVLGVVFILFGIIVKMYPVPITIISLVLYVGAALVLAVFDPESILRGLIIKILIVVALASSIRAAIAYEKERGAEEGAWQSS
jgi:hypothetical protein